MFLLPFKTRRIRRLIIDEALHRYIQLLTQAAAGEGKLGAPRDNSSTGFEASRRRKRLQILLVPHTWNLVGAEDASCDTRKWYKTHNSTHAGAACVKSNKGMGICWPRLGLIW